MNYGLPYKGSKNKIAEWVCSQFPKRAHFYDLFAGGCAITHCAMTNNHFETYLANDVLNIPQLFSDAVNGKYRNETRWISRDDFFTLKDTDLYVKTGWSFGNNGRTYLYSKEIEPYKKACHFAIVFNEWDDFEKLCPEVFEAAKNALSGITDIRQRRLAFGHAVIKKLKELNDWDLVQNNTLYKSAHWRKNGLKEKSGDLQSLQSLERLERLQSLERLESLQSLERLQRLETSKNDYQDIRIKENALIYCDIPYKNTEKYECEFDYERFYSWAEAQTEPVIVSEYSMPENRFICIAQKEKTVSICATATGKAVEKLFVPKIQLEKGIFKREWIK